MPTDAGLFADGVPGALRAAGACLAAAAQERHGPAAGASPERLAEVAAGIDPFPEEGAGLDAALDGLGRLSLRHGVDPAHPACAAHLHCHRWPSRGRRGPGRAANRRSTRGTRGRRPPPWSRGWSRGWPPGSATRRWPTA